MNKHSKVLTIPLPAELFAPCAVFKLPPSLFEAYGTNNAVLLFSSAAPMLRPSKRSRMDPQLDGDLAVLETLLRYNANRGLPNLANLKKEVRCRHACTLLAVLVYSRQVPPALRVSCWLQAMCSPYKHSWITP